MAYSDVFSELSAHFVKGMMFHDQMANYYQFLALKGYAQYHNFQFHCDSDNYRKLNEFYISHYNRLIMNKSVSDPKAIPETWYRYTRDDVDSDTKRTAIKNGIAEWINWETATLSKLQQSQLELYDDSEVASAMLIYEFIQDVEKELRCAKQMYLDLNAVDFDMEYILDKQTPLYEKYTDML